MQYDPMCIHGNSSGSCSVCEHLRQIGDKMRTGEPLLPLDEAFIKATEIIKLGLFSTNYISAVEVGMILPACFGLKEVKAFFGDSTGLELSLKKMRIREFVANWVKDYLSTPQPGEFIELSKDKDKQQGRQS